MQLAGRYQVLERVSELVGRGSFGVVVRAQDERTGAMVAVKVQRSTAHEAMLWSELRQLRRLRHPALPRVLEVGRLEAPFGELPARAPYLVTEWIGGSSLAALMRAPSRPSKEPLADLVISLPWPSAARTRTSSASRSA
ncbi:MAG TPA: protein kinase, partial [Kofleriaceae bacterium]|nr:protein kinase [Kofleriaceae bacterium]